MPDWCPTCVNLEKPWEDPVCKECLQQSLPFGKKPPTKYEERKKTNADRIRAMTDEELANFVSLCCGWTCAECPVGKKCNGDECFSTWLDWLKQEVGDDA